MWETQSKPSTVIRTYLSVRSDSGFEVFFGVQVHKVHNHAINLLGHFSELPSCSSIGIITADNMIPRLQEMGDDRVSRKTSREGKGVLSVLKGCYLHFKGVPSRVATSRVVEFVIRLGCIVLGICRGEVDGHID